MRRLEAFAAVFATLLALLLVALSLDVLAVWRDVSDDDFRFQTSSVPQDGLWVPGGRLPGSLGVYALGFEDDLRYRRAVALYARVQPGRVAVTGPRVESVRGQAHLELTRVSEADANPMRRSQLLNLLAVMPLDRPSTVGDERASQLATAIGLLQSAVRVDAGNADAKLNLELLLRDAARSGLPPFSNLPTGDRVGGPRSAPGGADTTGY